MRQLRYAGPGEDAAHIVVEVIDGSDRFTLVLDDDLRAAARQELPRIGGPETPDASLSPREIQTRVRGGASAEAIAEESGLAVDKVMRFAYPVLQERVRVADEARRARARRTNAQGDMAVFGEIVDGRLGVHGIESGDVRWDSFRRPDGHWTITAGWRDTDTDRFAQWSFALSTRVISALDETAADLLSDRPLRPVGVDTADAGHSDSGDSDSGEYPEDVSTVGGVYDQELADPTNPTGPIPSGLRMAGPTGSADRSALERALSGPSPAGPKPPTFPSDPAPRGLDSFFGPRIVPDPPAADTAEPPLPFVPTDGDDTGPAAPIAANARRLRNGSHRLGTDEDPESVDGKAARARIPSWDDILLGVRRRGD